MTVSAEAAALVAMLRAAQHTAIDLLAMEALPADDVELGAEEWEATLDEFLTGDPAKDCDRLKLLVGELCILGGRATYHLQKVRDAQAA